MFYLELRSWLLRLNCDPNGGMEIDRDFFLHDRPDGPARAHEVRFQNGDCTTEIFQCSRTSWGYRSKKASCSSHRPARR